jgi:hypothetical protein
MRYPAERPTPGVQSLPVSDDVEKMRQPGQSAREKCSELRRG